jgi:hypothetical protein
LDSFHGAPQSKIISEKDLSEERGQICDNSVLRSIATSALDQGSAMNGKDTDRGLTSPITSNLHFGSRLLVLLLMIPTGLLQFTNAQQSDTAPALNCAPLAAEQVIQNLVQMNLHRLQALHAYQGNRTYRVEYRGFPGHRAAGMVVNVKYVSGKKQFVVESSTGSRLIIDEVLKKLLDAEAEATDEEGQRRSALTEENYRFTLIGYETGTRAATYVLEVEPRTEGKFLYRGRIWVDGQDFAVVRLEAEPAKNPSFWTKKTEIVQQYMKVGDFWLPALNQSITAIRLGGHAELTIEYKDYEITSASRVSSLSMLPSVPRVSERNSRVCCASIPLGALFQVTSSSSSPPQAIRTSAGCKPSEVSTRRLDRVSLVANRRPPQQEEPKFGESSRQID